MTTIAADPSSQLEEQVGQLRRDGYFVIRDALSPQELGPIQRRYDELMRARLEEVHRSDPNSRHVEIKTILERDPAFETLMDNPRVFPLLRQIIGRDITLASGGEGDYRPAHTPAYVSWHNDFRWMPDLPYPRQNFWLRTTYFIDDVMEETGPFTLLPGTHLAKHACPQDYTLPDGQPREIPGMVRITGKAGTCLVNNTEIWHTNTPNTSDRPRKLIMLTYKHAWMRQWEDGYETTREFALRQTDPVRRQLCGAGLWHRTDGKWETQ